MALRFNLANRRHSLAGRQRGAAGWQRGFVLIVCVLMLPLPVPKMHRHDEIQSRDGLACHLATRHHVASCSDPNVNVCDAGCQDPTLDEPHWHFVLPAQYRSAGESEDDTPPAENAFLAFAGNAATAATIPVRQVVELDIPIVLACCFIETFDDRSDQQNRCRCAADAVQASRCALTCVMGC